MARLTCNDKIALVVMMIVVVRVAKRCILVSSAAHFHRKTRKRNNALVHGIIAERILLAVL